MLDTHSYPHSPTRPVTVVPAPNGFSTKCHTSPASTTTPSTGTTNLTPLRATASSTPTSPATNSVRSSVICQRCLPPPRDSPRISHTTLEYSPTRAATSSLVAEEFVAGRSGSLPSVPSYSDLSSSREVRCKL